MLRLLLLLALFLNFVAPFANAQDVACTPTVAVEMQSRTKMKHRNPAAAEVSAKTITVAEMVTWAAPKNIKSAAVRKQETAIDAKEDQVFTLEGSLWRVKIEDNDCDFHLEIADRGQGQKADRVIVEIPQGAAFTTARQDLVNALKQAGEATPTPNSSINLQTSLNVEVKGYGFYDAAHYSSASPKVGKGHGTALVKTLWELHPVWEISVK